MNVTLRAFIKKELVQTLRDVRMRALLFGAPVLQMTIFGLALSTEIKNIKLAAFSRPGDAMFERVSESFYASGWFARAGYSQGEDPFELIASGRADAVLIAPDEGLSRSAERGGGKMQLLVDASNASKARAVEAYAKNIIAAAASREYGARAEPALKFDVRVLYNPAMESSMFLVPGVMGMLVCLITIILTAMSLTREREMGTFETIVSAPLSNKEILLGKTVPYVVLGLADAALVVAAGPNEYFVAGNDIQVTFTPRTPGPELLVFTIPGAVWRVRRDGEGWSQERICERPGAVRDIAGLPAPANAPASVLCATRAGRLVKYMALSSSLRAKSMSLYINSFPSPFPR